MASMDVDGNPSEVPNIHHGSHHAAQHRNLKRQGQLTPVEADAFLDQRFSGAISEVLKTFCAIKVTESELHMLASHPEILNEASVDALRQLATRANNRHDEVNAFRYHRKSEIIAICLERGSVAAFANSLDNLDECQEFFDRVGPPPGYNDDYYDLLAQLYWRGDSLDESALKQAFGSLTSEQQKRALSAKLKQDGYLVAPKRSRPSQFMESPEQLAQRILDKYVPGFLDLTIEPPTGSLGPETVDDDALALIETQLQDRRQIISEFVHQHGGMKRFLNWISTMLPVSRLDLLATASSQFLLSEHPLKDVISDRQAHLLVPELCDPFLLCKDEGLLLFELMIRAATGRENAFPKADSTNNLMDTVEHDDFFRESGVDSPLLRDLHSQYSALKTAADTTLESIIQWVSKSQDSYDMHVPAILYLEWVLEDAVIHFKSNAFSPSQLQCIQDRRYSSFATFEEPMLLFRSRIIQLFLLLLIEKCLLETLPRPRPGQKRKRN